MLGAGGQVANVRTNVNFNSLPFCARRYITSHHIISKVIKQHLGMSTQLAARSAGTARAHIPYAICIRQHASPSGHNEHKGRPTFNIRFDVRRSSTAADARGTSVLYLALTELNLLPETSDGIRKQDLFEGCED